MILSDTMIDNPFLPGGELCQEAMEIINPDELKGKFKSLHLFHIKDKIIVNILKSKYICNFFT